MSEVEISVGGRRYTIACNPGEEKDVLIASEKLDKEAEHIVKNIGKVADVKLLLMAGLMIAGRLKTVEKELSIKSEEISELQNSLLSQKEKNQRLTSLENDSQLYDVDPATLRRWDNGTMGRHNGPRNQGLAPGPGTRASTGH